MRKIIAFFTLELFLISTLGTDFALGQGDYTSLSHLRPRSKTSAAEIQSALDGGRRHSKEEYERAHQELRAQSKRDPNSKELAAKLGGINRKTAARQSGKYNLRLSPIPLPQASHLTRYVAGMTNDLPPDPDPRPRSRRRADGYLEVNFEGIGIRDLPKSLGEGEIATHFERAEGRDLTVSFKPALAPPIEPPHARRYLEIREGHLKVRKGLGGPNELHELRRLRALGIDYEKLPDYIQTKLVPSGVLKAVLLFSKYDEPPQISWIGTYSLERLEAHLKEREERRRERAERLKRLKVPPWVRGRLASEKEILYRINLFENHGIPFSPLYWRLLATRSRQRILEALPALQLLHVLLRLYGIRSATLRNKVIESHPRTFLRVGPATGFSRLRRALTNRLGTQLPLVYQNEIGSFIGIFQQNIHQRDKHLAGWVENRAGQLPTNSALQQQRVGLIGIYDHYLGSGKLSAVKKRLRRLSEDPVSVDSQLLDDIDAFSKLIEHIERGEETFVRELFRGPARNKEKVPWVVPPPSLPRLFRSDALQEYESIIIQKVGEYLAIQGKGAFVPYQKIVDEAFPEFIDSIETAQQALGILSHKGFIFSYKEAGVVVLDPFIPPRFIFAHAADGALRQVEARMSPLRRYRDGLTDEIPPDHFVMVHQFSRSGSRMITLAGLPLIGLPESLGEPGDKVLVHHEPAGKKTRDLIASLKPSRAPETEPAHARFRLVVKDKHLASEKKTYDPDRQHSIRRLKTLGIDYEKLPDYIQQFAPSKILKKVLLFKKYGKPVLWGWVQRYSEEGIRNRLEAVKKGRMKNVFTRKDKAKKEEAKRSVVFRNLLPRLLKKEDIASQEELLTTQFEIPKREVADTLRTYELLDIEAVGWYLSRQKKRTLLPYEQVLKEASDLYVVNSIETLKRALGILSHQGFILTYKKDGVVVLDPWFPGQSSRYAADGAARDGAERQTAPSARPLLQELYKLEPLFTNP